MEYSPDHEFDADRMSFASTDQTYVNDSDSPSEMLVDSDDILVDAEIERDDVALIDPETERLRADDVEAMKKAVLPQLHEHAPILADVQHTWEITNWRTLPRRGHGPVFEAGGYPWRVLLYPSGNGVEQVSLYLEHGFEDGPPDDWVCCIQFGLVLWNPKDPEVLEHHTAHHRFTKEEGDWGFTRFLEVRKLHTVPIDDQNRYLIPDRETVNITAYVRVLEDETGVLWHNFHNYDSKAMTGYVGLKNQGATCYLNSLIQSLYLTNAFRKAVYQIPTADEETLQNSAYTLQRLFYQLQTSNTAVGTNELTKSFGWETKQIFEQQDVQELSRKLMERMEEKMKGTDAENILPKLFCGKVRTYISCISVAYESRRVEDFWDIQLNVSGNKNLEDSFKDYIQVEVMNGENQYFAGDNFKLQDAKKGVIFESFPDVLHLQLKRFQYDIDRDAMMKINDRHEFPETFDAAPYLSDTADRSEPWIYQLHGVLVHSGDLNAGHYYAFIKPNKDGWFYRYDDDRVTKATMWEVLEENYGGFFPVTNGHTIGGKAAPVQRQMSAYMLVYIRQTRLDDVLVPVLETDTPAHLQKKLSDEAAMREARKKERDEAHLYLGVKVITDDTYRLHDGTDLAYFGRDHDTDPAAPRFYRFLRKSTIKELLDVVGEDTGVDPRRIRFWCMVNRQNKTIRPDTPITDTQLTVEETYNRLAGNRSTELRLWAETIDDLNANGETVWPSTPSQVVGALPKTDLILIFLKWFIVEVQVLRGAGHIYISKEKKVEELVPAILKKMGWAEVSPSGERIQLKLFEEIKPNMIEPMKAKQSLKAAELQDGDIVCFQVANEMKTSDPRSSETDRESLSAISSAKSASLDLIEDARLFYDFLVHKRVVRFHPHPTRNANPGDYEIFDLTLSNKHTYDQIASKVGEKLQKDPTHIRFWTINLTTGAPKVSVKRGQGQTLQSILHPPYGSFSNNNQRDDSLYFEMLDMSLSELDTKKAIKVTWLSEGMTKEDLYDILVPKTGTVEDIVAGLIKKAKLDDEAKVGPIHISEVHSNRVYKDLTREHPVASITDYVSIIAEREQPDDPDVQGDTIQAFHFQNEPSKPHGIPFKFRLKDDELFVDTKKRLEKRTGMKGKNFEKIKFSIVKRNMYAKPLYLNDDDVVAALVSSENDLLGLDHVDRSRVIRNGAGDLFLK